MRFCSSCGSRFSNDARYCPVDGQPTVELPEEAPRTDPLIGQVVDGRYHVERAIGEGGMGVVYVATHVALQKRFALKVLRGDMARDQDVVARFVQEAQASTAIGHPNIVDISDFGKLPDGASYFVMEFLEGEPLTDVIARSGGMPPEQVVPILEMVASALSAAHARGIVHRDLKPDNIFLIRRGATNHFVKVLDFGIAKVGGAASKLTRTGMIFGTPHYMSPEQAAGQAVDKRTDIYAVGIIAYEMLTGRVPFDADTFMGILSKHMFEPPRPPLERLASSGGVLDTVVMKALVKKPEQRYQSMDELLADLATVRKGGRITPPASSVPPPAGAPAAESRPITLRVLPARGRVIAVAGVAMVVAGGALGGLMFLFARKPAPPLRVPILLPNFPVAIQPDAATLAAPRSASIRVESDPMGATVFAGEAIVGQTPIELPRPTEPTRLLLQREGYHDEPITLHPDSDSPVFVPLYRPGAARPEPAPAPSHHGGSHAGPRTSGGSGGARSTPPPPPQPAPRPNRPPPPTDVVDPWE